MSHKMYRALIEKYDAEDAAECCKADWCGDVHDTQGGATLSREAFGRSLFELADTWTRDVDAQTYANFLCNRQASNRKCRRP